MTNRSPRILLLTLPAVAVTIFFLGILFFFPPGHGGRDSILLGRRYEVPSRILGAPRGISVHLPEHYGESATGYPLLIKLFGGPWEYFAGLVGEVESLSGFGDIPPVIVVGVDQRGHDEVLPRATGGNDVPVRAGEFRDFLRTELIPWLEREYRTNGFRILLGTYDCGLFGVWTWLTEPGLFDAVLVTNPGWGRDYTPLPGWFAARTTAAPAADPFLHLTWYRYPPETDNRLPDPFPDLLRNELAAPGRTGLRWAESLLERESADAHRAYTSCREGLLALFRDYPCPDQVLAGGLTAIETYYEALSERLDFEVAVPEMPLVLVSDRLMETGRPAEALEVLQRLETAYPWTLNAVFRLAYAYRDLGDRPNALVRFREGVARGMPEFFRVQMEELERSAASVIEHELKTVGEEAGRRLFERVRSGRRKDLVLTEREMNAAGYRLLKAGHIPEAVALFEMNTELYPDSGNAWDSLGEALVKKGERERAIAAYRRSLELDPSNSNAVEMLRSLGIRP
jgi:tetratricopeptide (TPR) repeat protein